MKREGASTGEAARRIALAFVLAALPAAPTAAQTRAGTTITNIASGWRDGVATPSNSVALTVAERLDLTLAPAGDPGTVSVTLTNRGNGDEAFVVATGVAAGSATIGAPVIVGTFEPLADGRTPVLAPGATVVLVWPVAAVAPGTVVTVSARAVTGSGTPGTIVAGAGDGGGDAEVGLTGAAATLSIALAGDAAPTLDKSQTVRAPDGSSRAVRGAAITYTLVARFAAASASAEIADPIPAGTAYQPGSLSLDGAPLPDVGRVAAGQLTVPLGPVAAGAVRTLRFTVVIS